MDIVIGRPFYMQMHAGVFAPNYEQHRYSLDEYKNSEIYYFTALRNQIFSTTQFKISLFLKYARGQVW